MRFPYTMFALQTSFKPLLFGGVGGGGGPSAEMTVNGNGEHSKTLVPITSKNPASGLHDAAFVKAVRRSNHSSRCLLYNS